MGVRRLGDVAHLSSVERPYHREGFIVVGVQRLVVQVIGVMRGLKGDRVGPDDGNEFVSKIQSSH